MLANRAIPEADGLLWANFGLQQFHLPVEQEAQCIAGEITLQTGSLALIETNLKEADSSHTFAGTAFEWSKECDGSLRCVCPWGNQFAIEESTEGRWHGPQDGLSSDTVSGHPCLNVMHGLGISKVRFDVRPRTTAGIARFYEKYFGARIMLLYIDGCSSCRIKIGFDQTLEFSENGSVTSAYDGHHIAIYLSEFDACYKRLQADGFIFNNPRFPHLTYETLQRAQELNEFRILDIVDPQNGAVMHRLEHEIRHPLHHGFPLKELLR